MNIGLQRTILINARKQSDRGASEEQIAPVSKFLDAKIRSFGNPVAFKIKQLQAAIAISNSKCRAQFARYA